MYIRELRVDGYGALQGVTLSFDAPVTVLYGPNEAGKSTLLRFIRSMLYGFPTRKDMVERGEPVRGGRHGGRMLLQYSDGREWLIERYADRGSGLVVRASGGMEQLLSQSEWERMALGGITEKLFRQLFAVSLDELHQLRALQSDEIGNYLYHAGLAGGAALSEARRRITSEMERLYRPKGSTQEMNKALAAIKETESAIRSSQDHIALFNRTSEELEETNERLAAIEARMPKLRELAAEAKGAYELREWWLKAQSLRLADEEVRQELPDPAAELLPESAAIRWTELKMERGTLADKLAQLSETQEALLQERASYRWTDELLSAMPEIERLESLSEGIAARREEAVELEAERRMLEETLASLLARMSPAWGEAELRSFGSALPERDRIRKLARESEQATRTLTAIQDELERNARLLETAASEHIGEAVHTERASAAASTFIPSDRTGLLRAWHDLEDAMRAYERARLLAGPDAPLADEANSFARSQRSRRVSAGRSTGKSGVWLGGVSAILAAGAIAILLFLGDEAGVSGAIAAVSAMMLLLAGVAGTFAYRSWRSIADKQTTSNGDIEANIRLYRAQAVDRLSRLVRDADAAANSLMPLAAGQAKADEAWRVLRDAVYARLEELERADRESASRELALRRVKELHAERELLGQQATLAGDKLAAIQAEWTAWLYKHQLPENLDIGNASELFHIAEQALATLRQRQRTIERIQTVKQTIEQFEQAASAFADTFGLPPSLAADASLAVKWLHAEAVKQRQSAEEVARVDRQLETCRSNMRKLQSLADDLEAALQAFFAQTGCADEQALELRLRIDERSRLLRREAREAQLRLESGRDDAAKEKLYSWLQSYDAAMLAAKAAEQEAGLAAAEQERTALLDRRGRLMQELERLRTDAELADARQTLAEQEGKLEALLDRYAVLAVTERLMTRAKAVFEQERQPEVLRRASAYLSRMTDGAYERIIAPDDRSALLAETADRQLIDSAFLSRGTQEQLYLAMRFSLCDAASREHPLPLLLDDLFVHFDEKRLSHTLPVLETLAESRQLMLFTCHRHTANILAEGIKGAKQLFLR